MMEKHIEFIFYFIIGGLLALIPFMLGYVAGARKSKNPEEKKI